MRWSLPSYVVQPLYVDEDESSTQPKQRRGRAFKEGAVLMDRDAWIKKNKGTADGYAAYKRRYEKEVLGLEVADINSSTSSKASWLIMPACAPLIQVHLLRTARQDLVTFNPSCCHVQASQEEPIPQAVGDLQQNHPLEDAPEVNHPPLRRDRYPVAIGIHNTNANVQHTSAPCV